MKNIKKIQLLLMAGILALTPGFVGKAMQQQQIMGISNPDSFAISGPDDTQADIYKVGVRACATALVCDKVKNLFIDMVNNNIDTDMLNNDFKNLHISTLKNDDLIAREIFDQVMKTYNGDIGGYINIELNNINSHELNTNVNFNGNKIEFKDKKSLSNFLLNAKYAVSIDIEMNVEDVKSKLEKMLIQTPFTSNNKGQMLAFDRSVYAINNMVKKSLTDKLSDKDENITSKRLLNDINMELQDVELENLGIDYLSPEIYMAVSSKESSSIKGIRNIYKKPDNFVRTTFVQNGLDHGFKENEKEILTNEKFSYRYGW